MGHIFTRHNMKKKFDGFKKNNHDTEIELLLENHCEKFKLSPLDAAKHFPVILRRQLLKRFLAHTELFQMTLDVPGDIAELGVFRGIGLMTWANLLEAYATGNRSKTVYGFDNWSGFGSFAPQDGKPSKEAHKTEGGFSPKEFREELESAIEIFDQDRFVGWKPRVKLIDGDIENSVKAFVKEEPGIRFSLIHFDCDLYKPTCAALEHLWPLLSRGGVALFDEYGIRDWPGETAAVDEFIEKNPSIKLKTFAWTNAPAAYLIKP